MTFRLLTVCTGNICRSPLVERLLAQGLAGSDVEVSSGGTRAMVGDPMQPQSQAILAGYGGEAASFVARLLTRQMVADADLVLALTRGHRSEVAQLHPRATRYTFTLRELARIVPSVSPLPGDTPGQRLQALVPLAASRRGFVRVDDPTDDDIVDPYRRGQAVYDEMAAVLVPAVRVVVGAAHGQAGERGRGHGTRQ
jgi:protein-tyrosine phosphatase